VTDTATEHGTRTAGLPRQLFRHWVHSREEDRGDVQVYRPADFAFPPSFGRDGIEPGPDGRFVQYDIGPADGTVQVSGRWAEQGPGQIAVRFDGARPDYAFTVVAIDEDVLRIRLGSAPVRHDRVPCADEEQLARFTSAPPASGFRVIDFTDADVVTLESFPPQFLLRVSGTKPYANLDVRLVPLVYIRQPEYWGIEVVGSLPEIGLPSEASYEVTLAVTSFLGTQGIDVIGATRHLHIDIEPTGDDA